MTSVQSLDAGELTRAVDILHARYGLWRVVGTLLRTAWQRQVDRRAVARLPNSVRRDIGLPERDEEPVILWLYPWDGRL